MTLLITLMKSFNRHLLDTLEKIVDNPTINYGVESHKSPTYSTLQVFKK